MKTPPALSNWVAASLPSEMALPEPLKLVPLTGDAGFRQYLRVNSTPSTMAVFAPPEHEDVPAFVAKDLALKAAGVPVPEVLAVDYERGFMLQQDFGDQLLLPLLGEQSRDHWYGIAERELLQIQQTAVDGELFPPYDRALLHREMALFPEWFVEQLLAIQLGEDERELLEVVFRLLEDAALEQPQVVVHRDYHSRNLMVLDGGELGIIDFQDAVVGPFSYDLVSLLKDCYIRCPAEMVRVRAQAFLEHSARRQGLTELSPERLLRWFDLMGLQRHLKVLGIFARLWLRDGKSRYLDDLPLVLRYTLEVVRDYPELESLHNWFTERVLPALSGHSWYRDWQTAGE